MAAMSVQSVLSMCPLTALQAHNHKSLKLIQQYNNASSRWGLNNITGILLVAKSNCNFGKDLYSIEWFQSLATWLV